jgi:flavin-dependent dehydrogenase
MIRQAYAFPATTDVAVLGGGVTGASAAYHLNSVGNEESGTFEQTTAAGPPRQLRFELKALF